MTEQALTHTPNPGQLAQIDQNVDKYAKASRASATNRAYASQIAAFEAWCAAQGFASLPAHPGNVARYLASRATLGASVATLAQALTAISRAHVAAGFPSPRLDADLREVWRGICRTEGTKPRKQARALAVSELRQLSRAGKSCPKLASARDRAILLLGFAGGFRRAELTGLDIEHIKADSDGLVITVARSKTDQTGSGREVGIPYGSEPSTCPVRAWRAWFEASKIETGPAFRRVRKGGQVGPNRLCAREVARILQRAAGRAHVNPEGLSGHSLRAGLVTAATKAGKSVRAIMDQTGHKSAAIVARYVRSASLFDDNAASNIGL